MIDKVNSLLIFLSQVRSICLYQIDKIVGHTDVSITRIVSIKHASIKTLDLHQYRVYRYTTAVPRRKQYYDLDMHSPPIGHYT